MIIEMLKFKDAIRICTALNIPEELACQYHNYDRKNCYYGCDIIHHETWDVEIPNHAKAILRNTVFQSKATANEKVRFAILSQDLELVRYSLQDPKVYFDCSIYNPLIVASRYGPLDIVKLLVEEYGIGISSYEHCLLNQSCLYGQIQVLNYVLAHPDFDSEFCSTIFQIFSDVCNSDVVRLLLSDHRLDPSFENNQAIIEAANNGNMVLFKLLLEDPRVDPSDQSNLALISAASRGHDDILQLLLQDPRVDPSDQDNEAIIEAVRDFSDLITVKILLADPRVDPSDQKNQAIIEAVQDYSDLETFKILLADPRVDPSDQKNQAIIYAAENGNVDIVKLLIADPRVDPSDQNNRAISVSATNGHADIFKLLLNDPRVDPSDQAIGVMIDVCLKKNEQLVGNFMSKSQLDPLNLTGPYIERVDYLAETIENTLEIIMLLVGYRLKILLKVIKVDKV
jgi:ankyrin repeat protein